MTTTGQLVAASGGTATGLPAGVTFGSSSTAVFDTPTMAPSGAIIVRARLVGTGVTTLNERALILGHASGDMRVILRAGDLDPSGTFPNSQVLQTSGSTGLPLGSGTFGTQRISSQLTPPFSEFLMFQAQLYDPTNTDGLTNTGTAANNQILYWGIPGSLQILARRAITTAPTSAGANGAVLLPAGIGSQSSALNTSGIAVFQTTLSTNLGTPVPAVTTANDSAWVFGVPGALDFALREGDLLLGGTVGVAGLGNNCALNASGQILMDPTLSTTLGSTPATTANDRMVVVNTGGVIAQLMREGDAAVDTTGNPIPGVLFGGPTLAQGFANSGKTAFQCAMTGSVTAADDGAVFVGDTTQLYMVFREGDVAPGTGGETVSTLHSSIGYSEYGAVVGAFLVSPGIGVTPTNNTALYLCKPGSAPQLIVREGSAVPGIPGYVWGAITGSTEFGSSSSGRINDNGHIVWSSMPINNGTTQLACTGSWHPVLGVQAQLVENDVIGGVSVGFLAGNVQQFPSGDGGAPQGMTLDGDFVMTPQNTLANFVVRGKCATMAATPSAVPVTGGVPQNFFVNAGPANGNMFYLVIATGLGTRPGFPSPFGPQNIPLNFDPLWTNLSLNAFNTPLWINTLGLTDANGVGIGPSAFVMPAGYPGFIGQTIHHATLLVDFSIVSQLATEPCELKFY